MYFIKGEHPAMIDYMIWPVFERLDYLDYSKKYILDNQHKAKNGELSVYFI